MNIEEHIKAISTFRKHHTQFRISETHINAVLTWENRINILYTGRTTHQTRDQKMRTHRNIIGIEKQLKI